MEEKATSRQLWALYCITKKDYRGDNLSKKEASELIASFKDGKSPVKAKTTTTKKVSKKNSLETEFVKYVDSRMGEVVEIAKVALGIESVVMNDTKMVKDDGKRFYFCGFGCAIVYIKYDGRSKLAAKIDEMRKDNYKHFVDKYHSFFDKKTIEEYKKKGYPVGGLFNQDERVQITFNNIVLDFMRQKGVKKAYVHSHLD